PGAGSHAPVPLHHRQGRRRHQGPGGVAAILAGPHPPAAFQLRRAAIIGGDSGVDIREFPLDDAALEDLATRSLGPLAGFVPLSGDASTRRFFRALRASGGSLVAMALEGPIDPAIHPQILVGRFFESLGLPVPGLEASMPEAGLLFYED